MDATEAQCCAESVRTAACDAYASSNRSLRDVAAEFGVSRASLGQWVNESVEHRARRHRTIPCIERSFLSGRSPIVLALRIGDWCGLINGKAEIVASLDKGPLWATAGTSKRAAGLS